MCKLSRARRSDEQNERRLKLELLEILCAVHDDEKLSAFFFPSFLSFLLALLSLCSKAHRSQLDGSSEKFTSSFAPETRDQLEQLAKHRIYFSQSRFSPRPISKCARTRELTFHLKEENKRKIKLKIQCKEEKCLWILYVFLFSWNNNFNSVAESIKKKAKWKTFFFISSIIVVSSLVNFSAKGNFLSFIIRVKLDCWLVVVSVI